MDSYISAEDTNGETLTVNKSKFISFAFHMAGEYKDTIKMLKGQFPDATHICWAYKYFDTQAMIDRGEYIVTQNSSDDGEPSGTAGMPILGAINNAKLDNVLVCVVRYFGGIKLGTAGLAKAYARSAKLAMDKQVTHILANEYSCSVNYSEYNALQSLCQEGILSITNAVFDSKIDVDIVIPNSNLPQLYKALGSLQLNCTKQCFIKGNK